MLMMSIVIYAIRILNNNYGGIMTCKIESCGNSAKERISYPSKEQRWYLNARDHAYYICDKCEDKGWKYNCVSDEYYLRSTKVIKINLSNKRRVNNHVDKN